MLSLSDHLILTSSGNLREYGSLILDRLLPTDPKLLRKAEGKVSSSTRCEPLHPFQTHSFNPAQNLLHFFQVHVHITTFPDGIPYEPYPPTLCGAPGTEANLTINHFMGRDDAINAMLASSFISYASGRSCATTFRNYTARDGGYSRHMPCPPGKAGKHCLKVGGSRVCSQQPATTDLHLRPLPMYCLMPGRRDVDA